MGKVHMVMREVGRKVILVEWIGDIVELLREGMELVAMCLWCLGELGLMKSVFGGLTRMLRRVLRIVGGMSFLWGRYGGEEVDEWIALVFECRGEWVLWCGTDGIVLRVAVRLKEEKVLLWISFVARLLRVRLLTQRRVNRPLVWVRASFSLWQVIEHNAF